MSRIRVFKELGIFDRRFTYVESASLSAQGLYFSFHPRNDAKAVRFRGTVTDSNGRIVVHSRVDELDASKRWLIRNDFRPDKYLIELWLEDELAFQAFAEIDDLPF